MMTDEKQRGYVGADCNELSFQQHRHDRVDAGRTKLMTKEAVRTDAEQKVKSFTVRKSIEVGNN